MVVEKLSNSLFKKKAASLLKLPEKNYACLLA